MRQFGYLCTKTHRIRGLWDDACLKQRVHLEAAFVVAAYHNWMWRQL